MGLFFLYLAYATEVDGSKGKGLKERCLFTTETLRQASRRSAVSSKCLLPSTVTTSEGETDSGRQQRGEHQKRHPHRLQRELRSGGRKGKGETG